MDGLVKPVLALDLDGTLTTHERPFQPGPILDPPIDGALAALESYAPHVQLVVHSARADFDGGVQQVIDWLAANGFGLLPVTVQATKPPTAFAFLDDLSVSSDGQAAFDATYPTVAELLGFRPWWRDGEPAAFPPLDASDAQAAVASLAARASAAELDVLDCVSRAVAAAGGTLAGLEHRLKDPGSLAAKVATTMVEQDLDLAEAASEVKDALRFTVVLDGDGYVAGIVAVLDLLERAAGLRVDRLRNYWLPDASDGPSRYAEGTYLGVNVVLACLNGYRFELQFHTPQSLDVQQANWGFYRVLRSRQADPGDAAAMVGQMRANNDLVPRPAGLDSVVAAGYTVAPVVGEGEIPASARYRPASAPAESCATCSFFGAGSADWCGMWGKTVRRDYTCDEWADGIPVSALPDSALVAAVSPLSTMVALKPRPEEAAAIADPGGDPADSLHVTLAYLGEVEDDDLPAVVEALGPVAASHAPLEGTVSGWAVFGATPSSDGLVPAILLPDVPGLVELRVAVTEALVGAGIDYARTHGFTAHLTLDYIDPDDAQAADGPFRDDQAGAPLHFDGLLLVRGDALEADIPLTGAPPLTASTDPLLEEIKRVFSRPVAAPPMWEDEDVEAWADAFLAAALPEESLAAAGEGFCLPAELRTKTDPVRQEFLKTVMTPSLEQAGISFDVTNPLAAHALSQAGKHVVSISQTTQADVMKVVAASHDQGLSIPDTAKAIRTYMDGASATRATTIARTELAAAANGGSLAATKTVAKATRSSFYKQWMTAPGALYPRHELVDGLDGQTVGLEDYFDVDGDQLQYPGDPDGDAENVINCRCAMSYSGDPSDVDGMDNIDAAAPPGHPVHAHNAAIRQAYKRVDALEPRLAAVLEPILRRAGEVAAANFEALATDHMTAAGDAGWTAPSAEELLPVSCDSGAAADASAAEDASPGLAVDADGNASLGDLPEGTTFKYQGHRFRVVGRTDEGVQVEHLASKSRQVASLDSVVQPAVPKAGGLVGQRAESYLNGVERGVVDRLTDAELRDVDNYVGVSYRTINAGLRGSGELGATTAKRVANIDAAIEKAPALGQPVTLWRGLNSWRSAFGTGDLQDLVGRTVEDKGFASTTTRQKIAYRAMGGQGRYAAIVKVQAPAGQRGLWVSGLPRATGASTVRGIEHTVSGEEGEFLLPRGSRFQVVKVTGGAGGSVPTIEVRIVP